MAVRWVKLELAVAAFDARRFADYLTRCETEGIRLCTLAELGDTPENRRALYALNKECSADIPERGAFFSYEEYAERRFAVPSYDPRAVVLALDGAEWIGMAAMSKHGNFVFNQMTGVRAGYRGRGISIAMKTLGMRFAKDYRAHTVRTFHHPANTSAIAMNRRLGFVDTEE
ncbi:GCN5-related N-acetyltransferase [Streptomyces albus]|uniref:GCN5-related N-acetyltransferase n=1 Tax=Streptomyces albus (strain ATCC 21838 / DSM 41398 / FERM P-419 / JCM 4703 / NBRC 107858) TaxID=1081613 RepID=A0A0B5EU34_STRA4|nr:GCN5-related N-acetyltransferase [Streptomyces albus]AOU79541.1 GCN5-related N-acetyltransferase [Streptomyces albus]AYN35265.1 GCN5-related N-acetyltransferase [Streptomyces albus]